MTILKPGPYALERKIVLVHRRLRIYMPRRPYSPFVKFPQIPSTDIELSHRIGNLFRFDKSSNIIFVFRTALVNKSFSLTNKFTKFEHQYYSTLYLTSHSSSQYIYWLPIGRLESANLYYQHSKRAKP